MKALSVSVVLQGNDIFPLICLTDWVVFFPFYLKDIIPANTRFNKQFLDLLRRIFLYDPKARITAKEAMKHPWFSETTTDDGSEAARLRLERDLAPVGE